ncbi:hypothetical protein V3C99_008502 [Haemonchus contortus]
MSKSRTSERTSLLRDDGKDTSKSEKRASDGRTSEITSTTAKGSATTVASRENQSKSKEAFDEVSIEGPKKSDGSEFKKGPKGWAMSFIYLGILWMFGFLFTALIMHILLIQLEERPHYFGRGSHIGGIPGLIFEPNPNRFDVGTKGVIQFQSAIPQSYYNYMVRYGLVLDGEYNNTQISKPKCTNIAGATDGAPTNRSVCSVEAGSSELYGACALTRRNIDRGMGFSSGEPCIMLRLTRMLGWFPDDYTVSKERVCLDGSTKCCNRKRLQFSCEAVKSEAKILMLPKDGISTCAFPFWNQQGYEQPFVMLKITQLSSGKTEIKCRPSQKSIQYLDDGHENMIRIFIELLD